MALPNLIIAGAPKCGTSSLFQWIADHPDAEGSSVKETCYFADADSHVFDPTSNFAAGGLAGYERFFPTTKPKARIRLEATPTYIYQESAFAHLPDLKTAPRFVFVLREPARQILSTYRYFSNNWHYLDARTSFADFLDMAEADDPRLHANELLRFALRNARYVDHLSRWRERLGADRMRVMLLEDLQQNRDRSIRDLATWLGLEPSFYESYGFPRENETYLVKNRTLQAANIRLRGLVAKTPLYEPVRALYRRLNTTKAPPPTSARDAEALLALHGAFQDANKRLADAFAIDISAWEARPCP